MRLWELLSNKAMRESKNQRFWRRKKFEGRIGGCEVGQWGELLLVLQSRAETSSTRNSAKIKNGFWCILGLVWSIWPRYWVNWDWYLSTRSSFQYSPFRHHLTTFFLPIFFSSFSDCVYSVVWSFVLVLHWICNLFNVVVGGITEFSFLRTSAVFSLDGFYPESNVLPS